MNSDVPGGQCEHFKAHIHVVHDGDEAFIDYHDNDSIQKGIKVLGYKNARKRAFENWIEENVNTLDQLWESGQHTKEGFHKLPPP